MSKEPKLMSKFLELCNDALYFLKCCISNLKGQMPLTFFFFLIIICCLLLFSSLSVRLSFLNSLSKTSTWILLIVNSSFVRSRT